MGKHRTERSRVAASSKQASSRDVKMDLADEVAELRKMVREQVRVATQLLLWKCSSW